jgi:capsule polysaccharide export protein KpsE/RkpR
MSGALKRRLSPGVEVIDPPVFEQQIEQQEVMASRKRQAEFLRLLWDRRPVLRRAGLVALIASVLLALFYPAFYTSTAELMPPDNQSSAGMAMMAALAGKASTIPGLTGMAGDLLGLKSSGAMFIGVLRSETAQDRIVQQFDLRKVYGKRRLSDAREKLDDRTSISEDKKSGIISINVTDHSPERAAALANAYVDQLNSLVAELSTSAAHRERVFLEGRLKVAKTDLDQAANALAQFSSKNSTLDMQTEGKAMLDAAAGLTGQLVFAQSELQGLRQIYTDNNPRVKALNGRVAELRKQLDRLSGTQAAAQGSSQSNSGASAESTASVASGNSSPANNSMPFPTIRNLPLLGAKYSDYYRNAKIQETVFELLTEQYELARVEEAKETPSVKVLDPGRVPEKRSSASRLRIILLGTFVGLTGAVLWIFGQHKWEHVDSDDPRKVLAQEVAASLKARSSWGTHNGSDPARKNGFWNWLGKTQPPGDGDQ